jgi:hypothetical protein
MTATPAVPPGNVMVLSECEIRDPEMLVHVGLSPQSYGLLFLAKARVYKGCYQQAHARSNECAFAWSHIGHSRAFAVVPGVANP